jgi:hypothetical protein
VGAALRCILRFWRILFIPYACGCCAFRCSFLRKRRVHPLRMWVLRSRDQDGQDIHSSSPTPVGAAAQTFFGTSPLAFIPYACGCCYRLIVNLRRLGVHPLRLWVLRHDDSRFVSRYGSSPTPVGAACSDNGMLSFIPYACGCCGRHFLDAYVFFSFLVFVVFRPRFRGRNVCRDNVWRACHGFQYRDHSILIHLLADRIECWQAHSAVITPGT